MMSEQLARVLSEFARTLLTDYSVPDILDELVRRVAEILPVSAAGVTLISSGAAPHYIAASDPLARRFEQLQTDVGEGPCVLAHRSGQAVQVPDLSAETRFTRFTPAATAEGLGAVFAFPLRHRDGCLGALDLYRETPGQLDSEQQAAAQTLADVAAAYLLNARARETARETSDRFRHTALHDALTDLPNRLLLQERLAHAADRARRSKAYTGVLFVDLDAFKRINDTYGHETGDAVLLAVAHRLRALARPGDTVARVYGDEFVLVCEDLPTVAAAEEIATRILGAFTAPFAVGTPRPVTVSVTASIGLAYAGPGEDVHADLLVNADIAMYRAKRDGGARHQILDLRAGPGQRGAEPAVTR